MTLLSRRPASCVLSTVLVLIMYAGAPEMSARGQESAKTADDAHRLEPAKAAERTYRVIVFGAHPDDCELGAGGTAAQWAKRGFAVKFVSLTNGDIGHHEIAGAFLARRRLAEVQAADKILGVATHVVDNHDGELMPTLENRRIVTRLIRDWKADVVIAPRPNDYHPDHRYTGVLVQDAAYMVTVPSFCPDVPALADNPVFLYTYDSFQKPNPFAPDVVVPIDAVWDLKLDALDAIESQFYEWLPWIGHYLDQAPKDKEARKKWLGENAGKRYGAIADKYNDELGQLLGQGSKPVRYAEAFEVCEYGRRPSKDELLRIFPFFGEAH